MVPAISLVINIRRNVVMFQLDKNGVLSLASPQGSGVALNDINPVLVKKIDLSNIRIGAGISFDEFISSISDFIRRCAYLEALDLSRNTLSADNLKLIADALISISPARLLELRLARTELERTAARHLIEIIDGCKLLQKLTLADCKLGDEWIVALSNGLVDPAHRDMELNLSGNGIGPSGIQALMKSRLIRILSSGLILNDNPIQDKGFGYILRNKIFLGAIRKLELENCHLTSQSMNKLEAVAKEHIQEDVPTILWGLHKLVLSRNQFDPAGIDSLSLGLRHLARKVDVINEGGACLPLAELVLDNALFNPLTQKNYAEALLRLSRLCCNHLPLLIKMPARSEIKGYKLLSDEEVGKWEANIKAKELYRRNILSASSSHALIAEPVLPELPGELGGLPIQSGVVSELNPQPISSPAFSSNLPLSAGPFSPPPAPPLPKRPAPMPKPAETVGNGRADLLAQIRKGVTLNAIEFRLMPNLAEWDRAKAEKGVIYLRELGNPKDEDEEFDNSPDCVFHGLFRGWDDQSVHAFTFDEKDKIDLSNLSPEKLSHPAFKNDIWRCIVKYKRTQETLEKRFGMAIHTIRAAHTGQDGFAPVGPAVSQERAVPLQEGVASSSGPGASMSSSSFFKPAREADSEEAKSNDKSKEPVAYHVL